MTKCEAPERRGREVGLEKLTEYLLSETHPVGKSKANFFISFGFTVDRPEELLAAFLKLARTDEVKDQVLTPFGTKYVIDGMIRGSKASAAVRTVWFIERDSAPPRLVTAYPAPVEEEP